jgi:hypothetical protein
LCPTTHQGGIGDTTCQRFSETAILVAGPVHHPPQYRAGRLYLVQQPDEASIARHDKKSPQADFGDLNHAFGGTCWRTKAKRFSNLL